MRIKIKLNYLERTLTTKLKIFLSWDNYGQKINEEYQKLIKKHF